MTDETTAALQALIKQVETLTATVTDQAKRLDGLHDFNTRVLDEKKDLQRKLAAKPNGKSDAEMEKLGLERGSDGNWYPKGTRPTHSLTRAEARDPHKYREAKAAAEKAGATLQIIDPDAPEDAHRRGRPDTATSRTTVIKDEDTRRAYVRRDVMGSSEFQAQYRKLREDGFTPVSWDQPDELPQHMQTKFALMEKSHDAN